MLERLEACANRFRPHFNHPRQALRNGVYLRGLIQEGERKSIEPISRRVSLPAALAAVADPEQALQQFVTRAAGTSGPWPGSAGPPWPRRWPIPTGSLWPTTNDPARLDRAGVPREERRDLTKGQIALERLDQARAEGWPGRGVVADSGYGLSGPFRRELEARGLSYVLCLMRWASPSK